MSESKRTITVLYFAAASSATGVAQEDILIPNNFNLSELSMLLVSRYAESDLEDILNTSNWSVNLEMVDDPKQVVLEDGDEVGVICPVSGG